MELWDIYDRDRLKTEKTMGRGEAFANGAYHLVVQTCVLTQREKC